MLNFKYNESHLDHDGMGDFKKIEKSGCFVCVVDRVQLRAGSNGSQSQAVEFHVTTADGERGKFKMFLTGKDGKPVDFQQAMFSQVCYKAKINPSKLEYKMEGDKTVIPNFQGITFGAFLEAEKKEYLGKEYYELSCKGFFDANTFLTTSEERKGETEAKRYNYHAEKFGEPLAFAKVAQDTHDIPRDAPSDVKDDDEFPF